MKLYTVVRQDMVPGQQIVQTAHAVADWVQEYPQAAKRWQTKSNTMVVLSARNERELACHYVILSELGFPITAFYEPDIGDSMTAFSVLLRKKEYPILSYLRLAGN